MVLSPAIQAQLAVANVTPVMPGWTIIQNAHFLPPLPCTAALFGDPVPQALRKFMKAYYDYGRIHWTWAQAARSLSGRLRRRTQSTKCSS